MNQKDLEKVLIELKKQLDELNKTIINNFPDKFKKDLVEASTESNGE